MDIKKLKIHFGKLSFWLAVAAVVLLAADLVTKILVEQAQIAGHPWKFTVIPNFIFVNGVTYNKGAAFSFLADTAWGQVFLIGSTCLMTLILFVLFLFLPEKYVILKIALAMILSGAIGNLVDRMAFHQVRDFVWMNIFGRFACCNLADFWIVLGAVLAAVDVLFIADFAVFPIIKYTNNTEEKDGE